MCEDYYSLISYDMYEVLGDWLQVTVEFNHISCGKTRKGNARIMGEWL